jgi:hypothetical protein
MKKLFTLIALIVLSTINAQAPQGFNYQATVRNNTGQLLLNQTVLVKFNILQNSDTGSVVYSENQTANTDDLGHINLVVGQGTATTGTFASINWANGTYYLGIELNTGTGYVAMGTTQLLSVPYALHANTATSTTGNSGGFTHYIGELFGGGIVVSVWKDAQGVEHGLIASLTDLGTSVWSNVDAVAIGSASQSTIDGQANVLAIISQSGHTNSAAKICNDYVSGGFSDWYLPAKWELKRCFDSTLEINRVLGEIDGFKQTYWSSSEDDSTAWWIDFSSGMMASFSTNLITKASLLNIRAIRKF